MGTHAVVCMSTASNDTKEEPASAEFRRRLEHLQGLPPEAQDEAQAIACQDEQGEALLASLDGESTLKPSDMIREDKAEDADEFQRIAKELDPSERVATMEE